MELRDGEVILKKYRHHPIPFVWMMIKVFICAIPLYVFLYLAIPFMNITWMVIVNIVFFVALALVVVYMSLVYWLDTLVITNHRVVCTDYKLLTDSERSQSFINDIQDIVSHEKGILSYLWIFDYGTIRLESASSDVTIVFKNAPDPEAIRQFVYHIRQQ